MDLKTLLLKKQTILLQQDVDGCSLLVKEAEQYRWFQYAGESIQSLMNKAAPEQIIMPVYQSLLLFLLLDFKALNVLNLGLGGASIERTLTTVADVSITSVDASQSIINMAKRYFHLPEKVKVVCQRAELFIQQTTERYDVVVCDLFIGEKNPHFLFTQDFYQQLTKITADNATVMINIQADTDEQLLHALLAIKKHFPYIVLIELDDYTNIVVMASMQEIPAREVLQQRLANFTLVDFTCLDKAIERMHYIPCSKN